MSVLYLSSFALKYYVIGQVSVGEMLGEFRGIILGQYCALESWMSDNLLVMWERFAR